MNELHPKSARHSTMSCFSSSKGQGLDHTKAAGDGYRLTSSIWGPLECVGPLARQTLRLGDLSGRHLGGHAAYITWDEFERNVKAIANNATCMSSALVRGAARKGELLLPGLLRCGHCGRKLHVHYGGKLGRYNCYGARMNHGDKRCISVSGLSIDAAIAKEVLCGLCHGNGSPLQFAG
jgi:hypothetical protein